MITVIILTLLLLAECLVLFYKKRKALFQLFSQLNVPGPQPHWILGNLLELQGNRLSVKLSELSQKFGAMWGFYEGPRPVLIISDADLVHEFYINKANNFLARKLLPIDLDSKKNKDSIPRNIFQSQGPTWRLLRSATEPAFTDKKLSTMESVIDKHIAEFVAKLPSQEMIDTYPHIMRFGLDLNCECFFGISLSDGKKSASEGKADTETVHPIHKGIQNFFLDMQRLANSHGLWALAVIFPEFHSILRPFCARLVNSPAVKYLKTQMSNVLEERLKADSFQKTLRKDLLESLIGSAGSAQHSTILNNTDIVEQVQVFLYAGYETTATALAYVLHCLASHEDVQQELREALMKLPYPASNQALNEVGLLNNVIKEALRLYPVVSSLALGRQCTTEQSVTVNGVQIPSGVFIAPDVYSIHRNPQYWGPEDPNQFNPKRPQLEERNNFAWLAFGIGPRRCMGQKFALITIRRAVYQILLTYRLESQSKDLELIEGFNILPKSVPIRFLPLTDDVNNSSTD